MDLQKWMTRFQLTGNRLIESWMDLLPDLLTTSTEAILFVARRRQEHEDHQAELAGLAAATPGQKPHVNVQWTDEHALIAFRQLNENRRQQQRMAFPLGDNLLALICVSLADLTQDQRSTLTSIMTHRGRTLDQYNVQELRDLFLDMFCTTKTAVHNPMMQPSGIGQRRSFLVLEEGELEGTDGYWAEDDEDDAEGFLDALEDVFMTLTTHGIREGSKEDRPDEAKIKEREKEKGKAEEDEGSSDQGKEKAEEKGEKAALAWRVKKDMKMNGMKEMSGMNLMKAIGPMIRTGMKA